LLENRILTVNMVEWVNIVTIPNFVSIDQILDKLWRLINFYIAPM